MAVKVQLLADSKAFNNWNPDERLLVSLPGVSVKRLCKSACKGLQVLNAQLLDECSITWGANAGSTLNVSLQFDVINIERHSMGVADAA
jgi:hypothetical protein